MLRSTYKGECGEPGYDEIIYEYNEEGEVEDTSWKMFFKNMGYDCDNSTMIEKGLLELNSVRQIWMNHTQDAIDGEALDFYHSKNPEE